MPFTSDSVDASCEPSAPEARCSCFHLYYPAPTRLPAHPAARLGRPALFTCWMLCASTLCGPPRIQVIWPLGPATLLASTTSSLEAAIAPEVVTAAIAPEVVTVTGLRGHSHPRLNQTSRGCRATAGRPPCHTAQRCQAAAVAEVFYHCHRPITLVASCAAAPADRALAAFGASAPPNSVTATATDKDTGTDTAIAAATATAATSQGHHAHLRTAPLRSQRPKYSSEAPCVSARCGTGYISACAQ